MSGEFWQARWQRGDIGWHKNHVNEFLRAHWPTLDVAKGATVLVPLCGASLDMRWLAEQGQQICGIEISALAIERFFAEQNLQPAVSQLAGANVYTAASYRLLQGNLFKLSAAAVGNFQAIYDRAALIALPAGDRKRYAETLTAWSTSGVRQLLITVDYPQAQMPGPPYAVSDAEVRALYDQAWHIECLADMDGLPQSTQLKAKGVKSLRERVYELKKDEPKRQQHRRDLSRGYASKRRVTEPRQRKLF